MIGTAVGALAAVVLTAVFPRDRSTFLFTMVAWASACTFLWTLLRNFAPYAAVLAGYTLIIVVSTSIAAPDQVFEIAIRRASEICVGIVGATLVVALTDLGDSRRLSALLSQFITETAPRCTCRARTRAKSRLLAVGGQNPARRGLSAGGHWISNFRFRAR
jgi:uncharacterized membrane protein YccC